jgi:hypothetical protein
LPGAYGVSPECVSLESDTHALRGGAYDDNAAERFAAPARIGGFNARTYDPSLGFRCARSEE